MLVTASIELLAEFKITLKNEFKQKILFEIKNISFRIRINFNNQVIFRAAFQLFDKCKTCIVNV